MSSGGACYNPGMMSSRLLLIRLLMVVLTFPLAVIVATPAQVTSESIFYYMDS